MTFRTLTVAASLILSTLTVGVATGCDKTEEAAPSGKKPVELAVDQVEGLVSNKTAKFFDANGDDTRKEFGTLPGATLLSSYDEYDVAKELPGDKAEKLVFYCGSTACKAAEGAADRALAAGYTDVNVMPAGIKGWTKEGKPVDKVN